MDRVKLRMMTELLMKAQTKTAVCVRVLNVSILLKRLQGNC